MAPDESITRSPAFQFYPRDFLSDGNVAAMTMPERGVYITLLCFCWNDGSLPVDEARLARMCRLPVATFRKFWTAVEPCFRTDGDRLIQPRLNREREKQDDYRRLQSVKGKASAANRKSTEPQPSLNRTATEHRSPVEPDGNSSSSSASATNVSPPTGALPARTRGGSGSGVMAGSLPRDHVRHSWCSERLCVPDFIHGQLLGARGGLRDEADTWLKREWYPSVIARYPGVIGLPAEKFWPREFANEFPPQEASLSKRTLALMQGDEAFLRGRQS